MSESPQQFEHVCREGVRRYPVPFVGLVPDVEAGDEVECRTAADIWVRRVAFSGPRYDHDNGLRGKVYLTVAVGLPEFDSPKSVNWPAEDVRPVGHGSTDGAGEMA